MGASPPRSTVQPINAARADHYRMRVEDVATVLSTDLRKGLGSQEAELRLDRYGRNEVAAERPIPAWRRFLRQFEDLLVLLLLAAAAVSAFLWVYEPDASLPYEALAILAVVVLNATMGYVQESRAEAAVAALRAMAAAEAAVTRDGERRNVPAAALVPGDILLVEEGDTIAADGRLAEVAALQTAEAALTGESLPVSKDTAPIDEEVAVGDRRNMVFSGTTATYGHAKAIVTATGMQTEVGRIAGLLKSTPEGATPLQQTLDRTGKLLGVAVVAIAVVMITTIIVVQDVSGVAAILDVLILGVALAVAAVPEGLPAVVTGVLAIGVQRMARRQAIVRRLAAVETLGSATVIASDKTGTLTKNEMTVRIVVTASARFVVDGSGYEPTGRVQLEGGAPIGPAERAELERALAAADRANNASVSEHDGRWTVHGDPTEAALLVAARKAGLQALDERFPRVAEVPFSSERKLMSTIHREAEGSHRRIVFTKGAPDVVLARCSAELVGESPRALSAERRAAILKANEDLAAQALRTLGVACRTLPDDTASPAAGQGLEGWVEQDLIFAGLVGMIDPPRPEAREAVARARRAGIRPIMITGDHPATAAVIARELGLSTDGRAITGADLDRLPDDLRARTIGEVSVYARVNPEHKLRIVDALQRAGAVVAMTGDGVNDAPALKRADIGVAMGITGTDVAKEAADIVLADDNFATIVAAVEEGRAIFANIRKFLRYLLSSNIGEVLTMFFGVLLAGQLGLDGLGQAVALPLLATQILWINLVTDGPPALALGVDPPDPDLMDQPPRPVGEGVLTARMWRGIVFVGVVMAFGTLLVFDASLPGGLVDGSGSLSYAQTMAFTTLMLFQVFNVFNARSDDRSAFRRVGSNRWLWAAVILSVILQGAVVYLPTLQQAFSTVPLGAADWIRCTAVASSVLWLREVAKLLRV
jgi:P-type Ca2+ transporter type 2C